MKFTPSILLAGALVSASLSTTGWAAKYGPEESLAQHQPTLSDEFKQLLQTADIEAGAAYFERKCANCHDQKQGGIHDLGPRLWNWYGRKAGSEDGFDYSDAMKASGHSWDFATLDYYLQRTDRAVPGRIMNFRGIRKDKDRANLLAYLRQFNDTPPAMP